MSENVQPKTFRMKKLVPGEVILAVHPFSNPELKKVVRLTKRNPYQVLPLDWALGIFMDTANYNLYKKGYITFENNEALVKAAYEAGAYFDDKLDFTPATEDNMDVIFQMVSSGNRAKLEEAVKKYGRDKVLSIVIEKREELSMGVVQMCEGFFKTQLIIDDQTTIGE